MSLMTALEILCNETPNSCYHMIKVIKSANKNHTTFWNNCADDKDNVNFDDVFNGKEKYLCTVDFPSCIYWKEQMLTILLNLKK